MSDYEDVCLIRGDGGRAIRARAQPRHRRQPAGVRREHCSGALRARRCRGKLRCLPDRRRGRPARPEWSTLGLRCTRRSSSQVRSTSRRMADERRERLNSGDSAADDPGPERLRPVLDRWRARSFGRCHRRRVYRHWRAVDSRGLVPSAPEHGREVGSRRAGRRGAGIRAGLRGDRARRPDCPPGDCASPCRHRYGVRRRVLPSRTLGSRSAALTSHARPRRLGHSGIGDPKRIRFPSGSRWEPSRSPYGVAPTG